MEVSFNALEQRLLRYLRQEFVEKGSKPQTMHDPATMHNDVMRTFGLNLSQYREVMARFERHGIVRAIAIGAPNGHLQIDPVVVEIVRVLDDQKSQPTSEPNRMEQARRYFFGKWWFAVITIAMLILTAVATIATNLKTILEWFSF